MMFSWLYFYYLGPSPGSHALSDQYEDDKAEFPDLTVLLTELGCLFVLPFDGSPAIHDVSKAYCSSCASVQPTRQHDYSQRELGSLEPQ